MKDFEVRFEGELPATPREVWDAITVHTSGWYWNISYEPRPGGAERGLTSAGGTVTAWEPPRHFATRAERPDGWWNSLEYVLEPRSGGTFLDYTHTSVVTQGDYDAELDACRRHTEFYYHSLGEYLRNFKGRDAAYVEADGPEGSARRGAFAALRRRLGLAEDAAAGDSVRLTPGGPEAIEGVVDYATPNSSACAAPTPCTASTDATRGAGPWASRTTCSLRTWTPSGRKRPGESGCMTFSTAEGARPDGPVRGDDLRARDAWRRC
jgi:uncharacterized protein YndB with AHSA1/START domain